MPLSILPVTAEEASLRGCGRDGDAEQRSLSGLGVANSHQLSFTHCLLAVSLKKISVLWLPPRDAKHFSPVGDNGRNVICVNSYRTVT